MKIELLLPHEIENENIKLYNGFAFKKKELKILVMKALIEKAKRKGYNF